MVKRFIKRYYTQAVEDLCTRILYFFNTIDTYFMVAGTLSYILYRSYSNSNIVNLLSVAFVVWVVFKIADFYPLFLLFSPAYLYFLFKGHHYLLSIVWFVILVNLGIYVVIQFLFMSIPESIIARDFSIGIRKIWNSIFTIAPTTVSLSVSVGFSALYSLIMIAQPNFTSNSGRWFWLTICAVSLVTYCFKPRSFVSSDFMPKIKEKISERVIFLNIDGCRLDRFYEAKLPFLTSLEEQGSYFPGGLQTVYRALTNPAFASILTGAIPNIHGIKSNNLGQTIKVEALPDLVKTKLYGSMHVKHFSKKHWDTKIVSLPTHSIYKSDDIMFEWLKEDLLKNDSTRLFIADISETDFLGHAYGSESKQYLQALRRADSRIELFLKWLKKTGMFSNTSVIISSDHGIVRIDHSYLLFDAEKYVPFIIIGARIKENNPLKFQASIMDIAVTISYLLGVKYPDSSKGRVFLEAIK